MSRRYRTVKWMLLALGIVCAALVLIVLPAWKQAIAQGLPPRPPTPVPTPQPTVRPPGKPRPDPGPTGAIIELQVQFPNRETASRWPSLWTVVQWQDARGRWHDVEGWRGTLDRAQGGIGFKTWWLAEGQFGRGPFRWLVGWTREGPPLARSEAFTLPATAGETARVEVLLAP